MKYCGRCAADLEGASVCPVCGTQVTEKRIHKDQPTTANYILPPSKKPKDTITLIAVIFIVLILIFIAVKVIVFPYQPPLTNVSFQGSLIEEKNIYGEPYALSGTIRNAAEDGRAVTISYISIRIGSTSNVVLDGERTYRLEDIITNPNVTALEPGQSVNFELDLPVFKDEITVYDFTEISYYVSLYYNEDFNDSETFDLTYLYG